jgi:subtilisin family serine protease
MASARRRSSIVLAVAAVVGLVGAADAPAAERKARHYVVVYAPDAAGAAARKAIRAAGGRMVKENRAVGVATVRSADAEFAAEAVAAAAIKHVAPNRTIGRAPADRAKSGIERMRSDGRGRGMPAPPLNPYAEPFSTVQWNMAMIDADRNGSHRYEQGSHDVLVGVIDTGIEAAHPDVAANFNAELSRNFTVDIPAVDGPCEEEPDRSCQDPADVDEAGHGTHVAGTVAAPLNGVGIGGVAPGASLVNLRAGQDSGYFFLQPTVDALTYAGDNGIDVVNMSYFIDPWLFNCAANPADPPAAQAEQRTIIEATQRALRYAYRHGVTLVSALGNESTDLNNPTIDVISPDYPPGSEYERQIDNSCLTMPTEGEGVIGVSAVGPSGRKAFYSNYGTEQTDVAAPGGDLLDFPGTAGFARPENEILGPVPRAALLPEEIDEDGNPTTPFVLRDCLAGGCAYWAYFMGTSMASPHAAGVAALVVSEHGEKDRRHGGLRMDPRRVERILRRTALDEPCPEPRTFVYPALPEFELPELRATCEDLPGGNGFFGSGIVNALAAVRYGR